MESNSETLFAEQNGNRREFFRGSVVAAVACAIGDNRSSECGVLCGGSDSVSNEQTNEQWSDHKVL